MARVKISIDVDNLVRLYQAGMSEKKAAEFFGVDRGTIRKRLLSRHIEPRGRSESMYLRMSQTTPAERQRLSSAAHDAVRGSSQTEKHRCKIARTREHKGLGISRIEIKAIAMLRNYGFSCKPQKAIGRYNIDVAITEPRIAVEIFGGHWHASGRHAQRFSKRRKYILDQGWLPVCIWVTRDYPLEVGAIKHIVTLAERLRSGKAISSQEQMIRGDGKPSTVGKTKFDNFS